MKKYIFTAIILAALTAFFCCSCKPKSEKVIAEPVSEVEAEITSSEPVSSAPVQTAPSPYADYKVGDTLIFGAFEQDNKKKNGPEPIEWIVLDNSNDRLTLLSKYCLFADSYHYIPEKYKYTTWETSSMRRYLNSDFYDSVFSEEEKKYIAVTVNHNEDNHEYGIDGGRITADRVFFLSHDECMKYLPEKEDRKASATPYCKRTGAFEDRTKYTYWWLRSPGKFRCNAEYVFTCGTIYTYGSDVGHDNVAARPVINIDLTIGEEEKES